MANGLKCTDLRRPQDCTNRCGDDTVVPDDEDDDDYDDENCDGRQGPRYEISCRL